MNAKPIFVVVTFVLLIALFAGGAMSNVDLTPDTPPAPNGSNQVVNNFTNNVSNPINSPCGSSYTVQSGDTLSRIAQACNVTLADLLSANPSITNPNLIHPGQKLYIYYAPLPTFTAALPEQARPTAVPATAVPPTAAPNTAAPAAGSATVVSPASIPVSGTVPGGSVNVSISGLPGNTPVTVSIGKVGDQPVKLEDNSTDANGQIKLNAAIPKTAKPGELWQVVITSTTVPPLTVRSAPFMIK